MAERISDVPDDADWPEIEDDLVPEDAFVPDAGPYELPFAYLHGARLTLDADLKRPTKLLTVTAARSLLRVIEETGTDVGPDDRASFERMAEGDIGLDESELVDALAELAAFVEANITLDSGEA